MALNRRGESASPGFAAQTAPQGGREYEALVANLKTWLSEIGYLKIGELARKHTAAHALASPAWCAMPCLIRRAVSETFRLHIS